MNTSLICSHTIAGSISINLVESHDTAILSLVVDLRRGDRVDGECLIDFWVMSCFALSARLLNNLELLERTCPFSATRVLSPQRSFFPFTSNLAQLEIVDRFYVDILGAIYTFFGYLCFTPSAVLDFLEYGFVTKPLE
jgi:hypothetical protein